MGWILNNFRQIWFAGLFLSVLVYVIINWCKSIDFTEIDGNNILFGLLIVLAFCPLVSKVAVSVGGNKFEIEGAKASKESADSISAEIEKSALSNIIDEMKGESK